MHLQHLWQKRQDLGKRTPWKQNAATLLEELVTVFVSELRPEISLPVEPRRLWLRFDLNL